VRDDDVGGDEDREGGSPWRWGVVAWAAVVLGVAFAAAALVDGPTLRSLTVGSLLGAGVLVLLAYRSRGVARMAAWIFSLLFVIVAVLTTVTSPSISGVQLPDPSAGDGVSSQSPASQPSVSDSDPGLSGAHGSGPSSVETTSRHATQVQEAVDVEEGVARQSGPPAEFFDGELRVSLTAAYLGNGALIDVATGSSRCGAFWLTSTDRVSFADESEGLWYRVSVLNSDLTGEDKAELRAERSQRPLDGTLSCDDALGGS
jgi:hypothetical protein